MEFILRVICCPIYSLW